MKTENRIRGQNQMSYQEAEKLWKEYPEVQSWFQNGDLPVCS